MIAATHLGPGAAPYTAVSFTQPTAVVFGNESSGISNEALELADTVIKIPMFGMVQSLNLSVSVAIILYEAIRQRAAVGYYTELLPGELDALRKKWLKLHS